MTVAVGANTQATAQKRNGDPGSNDTDLARRLRECREFFELPELAHLPAERKTSVLKEMRRTGTYVQSAEEILIGAKLAWRNHARCVGRKHWRTLELIDARHATSAQDIADDIVAAVDAPWTRRTLRQVLFPVGAQAKTLALASRFSPGWLTRLVNKQLAHK